MVVRCLALLIILGCSTKSRIQKHKEKMRKQLNKHYEKHSQDKIIYK